MSENFALGTGVLVLLCLSPVIFCFACIFFFACRGCCLGRFRACRATKLPPEEAREIINSMQGEWDVTRDVKDCCGRRTNPEFQRFVVTGSTMRRIPIGSDRRGVERPMQIQPARASDGSLVLNSWGYKAVVFTPEQGRMEIEIMESKYEWRRVVYQTGPPQTVPLQVGSSAPVGIADQIQKLQNLREQGVLNEEEFSAAKNSLINPNQSCGVPSASYGQPPPYPADLEAGLPMKTY